MKTMINTDSYKLYQLMEFFTMKHSFNNVYIKELCKPNELWLFNKENKYQLIRISVSSLDETFNDKERINRYIEVVNNALKVDINFIDIHVIEEEVSENENYNTICLEENFYSGVDLTNVYPGIKNIIHTVEDKENEVIKRLTSINENLKFNYYQRKNNKKRFNFSLNNIVIIICCALYIAGVIIDIFVNKVSFFNAISSVSYSTSILLGADYKTFTLGLKQIYRLFTYAFLHGGFIHLLFNMYSLKYVGSYIEGKYGKLRYLLLLFLGAIVGSLTCGILNTNGLCIGMSGVIYAMFAVFVINIIKTKYVNMRGLIFTILINLYMNFMPGVAWEAHLGGIVIGIVFYYLFENNKLNWKMIIVICLLLSTLGYKYFENNKIYPIYGGTDKEILDLYDKIGLENYSNKIEYKLYKFYINNEGE